MDEIIARLREFREERDWGKFHTPENLSKSIVIEAAELLENFQWDNQYDQDNLQEELADVMIYCLLLADHLKLDVKDIINNKIDKNEAKYPIVMGKGSSKKYRHYISQGAGQ